jgi:hypothetical protein
MMPDKKLGEMTPGERDAAVRRAATTDHLAQVVPHELLRYAVGREMGLR